jgi:TPP-dependent trihydroxycyclohexane-1,2-dione (THcHDO) dehydratase
VPHASSSEAFQDWHKPFLAEAVAARVNRDVFQDTRLMLAEQLTSDDAQAVPVYGGSKQYAKARNELMQVQEALTVKIMQRLFPTTIHR